jgi:hypothetical protein
MCPARAPSWQGLFAEDQSSYLSVSRGRLCHARCTLDVQRITVLFPATACASMA